MAVGLRGKLFAVSFLLVLAGLLSTKLLLVPRLERGEISRIQGDLVRLARVGANLQATIPPAGVDGLAKRLTWASGVRFSFIATDGIVKGDGEVPEASLPGLENHLGRPEVAAALAGGIGTDRRRSATLDTSFLYVALPATPASPLITRVALPLTSVERTRRATHRSLLVAALLGVLVAAVLSSLAAQLVARPLRAMTRVSQTLAEGRFGVRADGTSGDELGELGRSLNTLSSELERTLGRLTAERDLLGAVLNSMVEGVLVTDGEGRILRTNPVFERDFPGVAPTAGAVGPPLLERLRSPSLAQHLADVRARRGPVSVELELPGPPARVLLLSSAPLAGGGGVVTVMHDMTEVRRLERIRRDFVANVSHELRTPVGALQGAAETLLGAPGLEASQAREFLAIIERNALRMGRLVEDLLELARAESDRGEALDDPVSLRPVVERCLERLAAPLRAKDLEAALEVDASVRVLGHAEALEQVLWNLLDNACKYTPAGGRLGIEAVEAETGHTRIVVWDTGPGLEPMHRERVFERFYRVDPGRSRELGGTGLGLAIVRHLAEAMRGSAGFEPRPGGGSRFWVRLRRA